MNSLIQFIINATARIALISPPHIPRKGGRDKRAAGLDMDYPGAKLVRKAQTSLVTVRHKGMRTNMMLGKRTAEKYLRAISAAKKISAKTTAAEAV